MGLWYPGTIIGSAVVLASLATFKKFVVGYFDVFRMFNRFE
jgi:hypothetical protein